MLLVAKDIVKKYSSKMEPVLNNLNLGIKEGEFTAIMGSSGSGKSTLLYLLSGLDSVTGGDVIFKESNISELNETQRAVMRRDSMGFIFQDFNMVSHLSILENLIICAALYYKNKKDSITASKSVLKKLGILELSDRLPSEISGGELQRTSIARALVNKPNILFADEPTGNLNSLNSIMILDELNKLSEQGHTILMVTHELKAACRADRVIYIQDGTVKNNFSLGEIKSEDREDILYKWLNEMGW